MEVSEKTLSEKTLMGGPSAYCISEGQLAQAQRLAHEDPDSSPLIQGQISRLERELSRNERAALAFLIIERLRAKP